MHCCMKARCIYREALWPDLESVCGLQIDLGENGESFALIYSIENPKGSSPRQGVGAQVSPCCNIASIQPRELKACCSIMQECMALPCR